MKKTITQLMIGDLSLKTEYKQMKKRVKSLPKNYRYAFKKIQNYIYYVGAPNGDYTIFKDLQIFYEIINLFEENATKYKNPLDVLGLDVAKFTDDFMLAFSANCNNKGDIFNNEIKEYFGR